MSFDEWLEAGVEAGWVMRPTCATHDGLPTTRAEEDEFEEGGDPCIHALRLCVSKQEQLAALANSRWVS